MNENVLQLVGQVATQAPLVLVYLGGIVLPFFFWQRARVPSCLTLAGSILMLVTLIGMLLGQRLVIHTASTQGWDHERTAAVFAGTATAAAVVRAIGFGMLVAAAFIGRGARPTQPAQ